ncbi:MAG: glycogen debranching protein, partial [Flammeovirgaceae bacterium]|nr:glycogen debranching protein [Flammeovirgaceae bacterium]
WIVIGENEHTSPLLVFGQPNDTPPPSVEGFLPTDYEYTFTVNMRPVLEQFEQKGYYEAYDGTRITKEEFKGVYIAGNAEPLTWDFANLENRGLKLNPTKEPFIYSITVRLNPNNPADDAEKTWQLSTDLSAKPSYQSDQPLVDALFNLSLEEAIKNIEPDSTFRTGAKWAGVWTRDISYSIFLAFAFHEPEVAKISLMKKVHRQRIVQDTGSGGAYPVSSDRMIWAIAAFEIFKTTGDTTWLKNAFEIIKNSAEDDFQVLYDTTTGLFRGESSFLDWREQTYPKWMDNKDIYVSLNLGTNVIHYQTYVVLAEMARLLGEPYEHYQTTAQKIKENINRWLWQRDKGYYGQYLYGRAYLNLSPRFEALGEALAILFDVADEEKANAIIAQSPITPFGVTCIYPQIPSIPSYHNNAIWPFVQSYWNLAAANVGNEKVLTHGLAAMYRPAALFLSNYENMVATNGDFRGTEINSERMLWSIAGNLAMVHRLFIGMNFELDGIRFQPIVPKAYDGTRKLTNFKYRKATLDITVKGFGNRIKTFEIDGENQEKPFFPATLSGKHSIVIEMNNAPFEEKGMNLVENSFSLPYPLVELKGNYLKWREVKDAKKYLVYRNGQLLTTTRQHVFEASPKETAEYKVFAVDERDIPSFSSEPIWVIPDGNTREIQLE